MGRRRPIIGTMLMVVLHVMSVGLWLGCAGAEIVIEVRGRRDRPARDDAVRTHYAIDLWIELPALLFVLASGAVLVMRYHPRGWMLTKVIAGVVAIAANFTVMYAVIKRKRALDAGNESALGRAQLLFNVGTVIAVVAVVVTMAIAMVHIS